MNSFSHHPEFEYYATNKREGTTQQSWRAGEQFHMTKITITSWVFYAAIKPRPGPWLNNPMLDNLLVTPRYSSDFHKNRLWVGELKMLGERSCECYGRNISWDAAASCLPALLPPSSHLTEPQSWPDSAAANPAICVELTGKGLYCQG